MKLFSLLSLAVAEEVTRYDGDKVYTFKDLSVGAVAHLKVADLAFSGFDFWSPDSSEYMMPGGDAHIHVSKEHTEEFESLMEEFDIEYGVMTQNLQHDIDMERIGLNRQGRAHSLTNYNDYETIMQWVKDQAAGASNAEYKEFGTTVQGRKMMAIEIGTGSKIISIDCGIHAREWVSPAYCQWFINEALHGEFAQYTSDVKFLIQPSVNPDGYAYTWTNQRMWRKNRSPNGNCYGVDLNRNYDANWGGPGSSGQACSDTYRGSAVFSENESKAQREYLKPYHNDGSMKAFVTFHSYGQYILYPYSYDYQSHAPNQAEMDRVGGNMESAIRDVHRHRYTMGQGTQVLYAAAGGSDDWSYDYMAAGGNSGPLSYTIELRDTGSFGFVLPASEIKPNAEEINAGMHVLIKYVIDEK